MFLRDRGHRVRGSRAVVAALEHDRQRVRAQRRGGAHEGRGAEAPADPRARRLRSEVNNSL